MDTICNNLNNISIDTESSLNRDVISGINDINLSSKNSYPQCVRFIKQSKSSNLVRCCNSSSKFSNYCMVHRTSKIDWNNLEHLVNVQFGIQQTEILIDTNKIPSVEFDSHTHITNPATIYHPRQLRFKPNKNAKRK